MKNDKTRDCVARLKILADATRLEIIRNLADTAKNVSEINESVQVPQNLLSHHLAAA